MNQRQRYLAQRAAIKEARRREIERRWLAGQTLKQIALELHSTRGSVAKSIAEMRKDERYNIPYRHTGMAAWCAAHPEHAASNFAK